MFHDIFKAKYTCWEDLEHAIERIAETTEKGDAFEQFVYFYLTFFRDLYQIANVYTPSVRGAEYPAAVKERLKLEKTDYGVDGVYETLDGKLIAYQAKFRSGRAAPSGSELATFWAEAEYADYRCVVANCFKLPRIEKKKKQALSILADKFLSLDQLFFESLHDFATAKKITRPKPAPRDYQIEMLTALQEGFQSSDRGKLLAACGTGKTLIALWCTEQLRAKSVLFLAPSLALIRQTLSEWAFSCNEPFSYLCVCSDSTVASGIDDDSIEIDFSEIDVPVTTNSAVVHAFLSNQADRKSVIFSTYHSLGVIRDAMAALPSHSFDICLFDEAHRTAGLKGSDLFALAIDNEAIPAKKRLFMTATERLVKPWIREKAESAETIVLSMDDPTLYGETFHRLGFGEAISSKIISDYKVILASIAYEDYSALVDANRYLTLSEAAEDDDLSAPVTAFELFKACLLRKCIQSLKARKIITYHSRVRDAKRFAALLRRLHEHSPSYAGEESINFYASEITGAHSAGERNQRFETFQRSDIGILTNVRCLSEGIDLPLTDAIFFADPRESLIDIVQAVGRTLRKPFGDDAKMAYVILPILMTDDTIAYNNESLESLHNVIQALRDQDELLGEWIDQLNLALVRGATGHKWPKSHRIQFLLPESVNFADFENHVMARVAQVNSNPTRIGRAVVLGKTERKSHFQGTFRCLGDYNADIYEQSLVRPTVERFADANSVLSRDDIAINNNNVSHSERIGVLFPEEKKRFSLTKIGKLYASGNLSFEALFRNQMLLFEIQDESGHALHPYRAAFEVMKHVSSINYIEFLYGLYAMKSVRGSDDAVQEAIKRIHAVQNSYPLVMQTSDANREQVRLHLNSTCSAEFTSKEVWTDRTTPGNRFRYFRNHMSLFADLFIDDDTIKYGRLSLKEGAREQLDDILSKSTPRHGDFRDHYGFWIWLPGFSKQGGSR